MGRICVKWDRTYKKTDNLLGAFRFLEMAVLVNLKKSFKNKIIFIFQVLGKVPTISVEKTDGCQVIKSLG
jgi:hypothetical protein